MLLPFRRPPRQPGPGSRRPGGAANPRGAPRNHPSDPSARGVDGSTSHGIPAPAPQLHSQEAAIPVGAPWGKRLIPLMEKRLNKSTPKPTLASQLTYNWRWCGGGQAGAGAPACEGNPPGSGQREARRNVKIREREEEGGGERRSIAEREDGEARRPSGLPGDTVQRGKGAGAARAGSARHRSSVFPALPAPPRVPLGPTSRVAPTATRGSGRGGEEQGPKNLVPQTALSVLHTWHPGLAICCELTAFRARVWAWRDVRILPGGKMASSQPRQ